LPPSPRLRKVLSTESGLTCRGDSFAVGSAARAPHDDMGGKLLRLLEARVLLGQKNLIWDLKLIKEIFKKTKKALVARTKSVVMLITVIFYNIYV
jgi:hypothetical protein